MDFPLSKRLSMLPPYLFQEIDALKSELKKSGADVINLGIGDPDLPTPPHIVEALRKAALNPANHQYDFGNGKQALREACADYYKTRFGVTVDPNTEIIPLLGSKEGIGHIHLAFVNPGEVVLVPEPGYPVYHSGTLFADAETYYMPLKEENDYLPDLDAIPEEIAQKAKMMFLCYPNNPIAVTAPLSFYKKALDFAKKYNIIIAHDAAYADVYYDGIKPHSFLEVEGAKEYCVEYYSLSKTYNMTGWRVAFAVGNPSLVAGLYRIKGNLDSGIFGAVQDAAVEALTGDQSWREELLRTYQERRDALVNGLQALGCPVKPSQAAFYVWAPVPQGMTSKETAMKLLKEAAVVATPGNGFGPSGEGYIRMTLTAPKERLLEAVERIKKLNIYK
ncbi:LL-diaminopimelate aminotransferase [bacterium]|nr:LL-diaminopimelate aminotransferase [bacterium]